MTNLSGSVLFICMATLFCVSLAAQTDPDIFTKIESPDNGKASVKITQNSTIRDLVMLHLSQQKRLNGIRGYRISIYLGSGQEANKQADQAKARFMSKYEEIKSYKIFEYPYFKIYVGDFRTKSEAMRLLKRIESDYPDAFIREDIISFPDEK